MSESAADCVPVSVGQSYFAETIAFVMSDGLKQPEQVSWLDDGWKL